MRDFRDEDPQHPEFNGLWSRPENLATLNEMAAMDGRPFLCPDEFTRDFDEAYRAKHAEILARVRRTP